MRACPNSPLGLWHPQFPWHSLFRPLPSLPTLSDGVEEGRPCRLLGAQRFSQAAATTAVQRVPTWWRCLGTPHFHRPCHRPWISPSTACRLGVRSTRDGRSRVDISAVDGERCSERLGQSRAPWLFCFFRLGRFEIEGVGLVLGPFLSSHTVCEHGSYLQAYYVGNVTRFTWLSVLLLASL